MTEVITHPAAINVQRRPPNLPNWLLGALVFCGGMTSIGIEIAASRLIAPYFGSSTFIWANLIGLTLTYLAIGYWIGGKVADRYPRPWILFLATAVAAIFAGLIPFMAKPILRLSLDAFDDVAVGAFYGSLVGTIFLFAIPITLLGFVTPYAIRLRVSSVEGAGNTAGNIYALSTVGSIVGSFLPVIVLIPAVGTTWTFIVFSLSLLVLSAIGLLMMGSRKGAGMAAVGSVVLVLFSIAQANAQIKPAYTGTLIYEAESAYNYIQVLQKGDETLLALNEGHAIHSIYNPNTLLTGGPWDYFLLGPSFVSPDAVDSVDRALILGLAGGTAARQITAAYPAVVIDGVEIDGVIADVGRKYFGLDQPNINVIIDDGRFYMRRTDQTYDIIGVDAYHQPYIPFQLTTVEFFREAEGQLTDDGVVVVNAGRTETDFRLVDALASTLSEVFTYVVMVDVERYTNTMIFASNQPLSIETLGANIQGLADGEIAKSVGSAAMVSGNFRVGPTGGLVFTDDHAPIEQVVDQMILDAALGLEGP